MEEKRLEEERQQELQDLRDRLAAETNDVLMEQERQLGLLIARLQVGQARRLAVIQKQDKTIKELEVSDLTMWNNFSSSEIVCTPHLSVLGAISHQSGQQPGKGGGA